ncbi:MAG: hypothetical protein K6U89_01640 [Chloroflexi bacterium]|nr:hypothetical protein [Chloroflexota bacterium]
MTTLLGELGPLPSRRLLGRRLPILLMLAATVVSVVSALLLIQTSGVAAIGYDIQRLEETRDHWRRLNAQLEYENARLKALDRIEREARTRLKMQPPPDPPLFVTVDVRPTARDATAWLPPASPPAAPNQTSSGRGLSGFLSWLATLGGWAP